MAIKFKKTYRFALVSTTYITLFSTGFLGLLLWFFGKFSFSICLLFAVSMATFSFFVIQYRVEKFIYRRVKKIYDDVSFLESTSFINQPITTDMATLTKQVKKFATDKKLEIETLKVREEYRREFMGNVSHELKTPLFTVQGYISTLLEGAMDDKKVRKKYLERAEKGVERLVYIVEDLDMIAKFEMGEMNLDLSKFNIVEVIQNVFDLLEMNADKKNIILMFDRKYNKAINVFADKDKIQQVVTNLVMNSIKYGKENGTTEVTIEDLVDSKLIVRIRDNGEGIAKQYLSRIFERFFRVDKSGARSEGGSGLGLSIVKHIIEAHGESIYVESEFGKGSEFSFTIEKDK
ncbi:MAG: ATP-binding protein [Flavobacterium sp.]|jgi:two-component system phosphate regulon sensor histidine kinase PhoR|uniref:histidine kinase n=1 Tax=Flavobacterium solisilvae TaxID=1852019 RepID=A0ABX1QUJ7_9FLAO|nr:MULTISPECIES: ATP-binding protein [Flavobacterium]MCZ8089661.1 ATP-binding protein [Flavobacterium sp.]MCZ8330151.1 ATP-binding protein [Flavobacterium sp.]NMH25008.1 sensor histidine kinase [Flavobacterium solisilvae]PZO31494.1 MAG: two-component sensor histidine kinase [Flavobacteriaceae bacterium]